MPVVEVLVSGGKATPGPPLGPALGPLGINVKEVVDKINELTADYDGMEVPVKIVVDEEKNFTITVGTPPTTALLKKEAGIEKGSGDAGASKIADLKFEQILKVARMKRTDMLSYDIKGAVKEVLGTCLSMGITVDGKSPKEVQKAIDAGEYDDVLKEGET
jgi:large subunit ribosomal protein L11